MWVWIPIVRIIIPNTRMFFNFECREGWFHHDLFFFFKLTAIEIWLVGFFLLPGARKHPNSSLRTSSRALHRSDDGSLSRRRRAIKLGTGRDARVAWLVWSTAGGGAQGVQSGAANRGARSLLTTCVRACVRASLGGRPPPAAWRNSFTCTPRRHQLAARLSTGVGIAATTTKARPRRWHILCVRHARLPQARQRDDVHPTSNPAAKGQNTMEAIGHKLFQLGDPEGKGFIVRRDMQVSASPYPADVRYASTWQYSVSRHFPPFYRVWGSINEKLFSTTTYDEKH